MRASDRVKIFATVTLTVAVIVLAIALFARGTEALAMVFALASVVGVHETIAQYNHARWRENLRGRWGDS